MYQLYILLLENLPSGNCTSIFIFSKPAKRLIPVGEILFFNSILIKYYFVNRYEEHHIDTNDPLIGFALQECSKNCLCRYRVRFGTLVNLFEDIAECPALGCFCEPKTTIIVPCTITVKRCRPTANSRVSQRLCQLSLHLMIFITRYNTVFFLLTKNKTITCFSSHIVTCTRRRMPQLNH